MTGSDTLPVEVAIVGGGLVGLTLGAALAGAGVDCAVIDRDPPPRALDEAYDGRASAIACASRRVLEGAGLWDRVAAEACPILDIRVVDDGSPLSVHYDHREVGDEPLGHIVENRALRRGLHGLAAGLPRLAHLAPRRVAAIERGARGVAVRLDGGGTIAARLLVGADGRASGVRAHAGIGVREWSYPQTGIVATVAHERPHRNVAIENFLPAGPFATLPMTPAPDAPHRSSIVWTERAERAPGLLALDEDRFRTELARRFGDHWGAVRLVGPRFSYPLGVSWAERMTADRIALVGDAAHVIHPIAGQGLNLGIRDVAALAEAVIDARRLGLDIGADEALRRYARWRRLDTLLLTGVTDGLNRLFSNAIPPLRLARRLGLAAVDRVGPLKRFYMRHAMGLVGDLPRLARGERL